jgi:hypothetical protein
LAIPVQQPQRNNRGSQSATRRKKTLKGKLRKTKAGFFMSSNQQSKISSTVRCTVCGQDFLIDAEPAAQMDEEASRRIVQHVLRTHHTLRSTSSSAHPASTFDIPSWSGAHRFSASASLNNLLDSVL